MKFSPTFLSLCFVEPLRYLFTNYNGKGPKYDADPSISEIEIGTINDFHKVPIQHTPRILVSRGGYSMSPTGLSDNMAEQKAMSTTFGLTDRVNMVLLQGQVSILIQARQEGTCEIITDMVQHFITWTIPFLSNTQGFKTLGLPSVSPCTPGREDTEIFEVSIGIPWTREEHWNVTNDAVKLKNFRLSVGAN